MKSASIFMLIALGAVFVSKADAAPFPKLDDIIQLGRTIMELVMHSGEQVEVQNADSDEEENDANDDNELMGLIQAYLEGMEETTQDTDADALNDNVARFAVSATDFLSGLANILSDLE